MKPLMPATLVAALLWIAGCESSQQWTGQTLALEAPQTSAVETSASPASASTNSIKAPTDPSSETALADRLVDQLGITSQQAMAGAGSVFALAQQRMNPDDFLQATSSLPGFNRYLSSVPQPKSSITWFESSEDSPAPQNQTLGRLIALTPSFDALGMNVDMIGRFVPVVLQYVQEQSGPAAMSLLQTALY